MCLQYPYSANYASCTLAVTAPGPPSCQGQTLGRPSRASPGLHLLSNRWVGLLPLPSSRRLRIALRHSKGLQNGRLVLLLQAPCRRLSRVCQLGAPMDSSDAMDPRSSTWRQSTASDSARSGPDDYHPSIADGFPSSQASQALPDPASPRPQPSAVPSSDQPPSKVPADIDRPSSISKHPQTHDSLTLRNDGSTAASRRHPTISASPPAGAFILPDGPYQGPTNPSHPYSMYPQRTLTNATSSTAPDVVPAAPAHPYALYTQTIDDDDVAVERIPVGFTGLGNAYQRQISPEGDETGDLLGALSPTEELPPYTRYPEGSSATPPLGAAHNTTSATGPIVISGAGGLGRATRDPEFSSAEDDLPAASSSHPATPGETASQHEINTAARDFSEKTALTNWQRRAKKKLCGIVPCWAMAFFLVGIIVVAVVVGAVVGTLLAKKARSDGHEDSQAKGASRGPSSDIEPLRAVPANLAPLATGAFCLPPLDINQAPKSCFNDPKQAQAWSCDLSFRSYAMAISRVADVPDTKGYDLSLTARNASTSKYLWGTQPPDIASPQPLIQSSSPRIIFRVVASPHLPVKDSPERPGIFLYPSQNISLAASPSDADVPTPEFLHDPMLSYPMVVKFLERRWCDDPKSVARCRQVEIMEGGSEKDIVDENGNPVEVIIDESWKSAQERIAQHERGRHPNENRWADNRIIAREVLELTDCGCLWRST
ncbi:hypothetical protein XA68_12171 [Ophiocordyceps unilateralis]|uniref:DUF7820 domain-containing protein n=1 Tax=Ophiocordyceps unilateralis TaxID=268505 RepID=A0A2A9PPC8_OPHUN|nr:hypothetical protein XA68_12171 [Ophiocordyceps unilateralis]